MIKSLIVDRLQRWKEEDGVICICNEARSEAFRRSQKEGVSVAFSNANRALKWAREGWYGNALRSLGSLGVAAPSDATTLLELQNRHP